LPEHLRNIGEWYWGAFPLTIHSAGWGIFANLIVALLVSKFGEDDAQEHASRHKHHTFIQAISGLNEDQKKWVTPAWILTISWFLVGFGPFATVGNTLFSSPNDPTTWAPLGLPSLWVWQLLMLVFGIFVMWMLAFKVGLSQPVSPEDVEAASKEHYPDLVA
jgi:hypothetical protein